MKLPIDRGWAWVITFACGGLLFWTAGNLKSRGVVIVEIMEIYPEKSATAILWIFNLSKLTAMVSGPLNGLLLAKTSTRFVAMLGVVVMATGQIAFAHVPTVEYMYLVYGIIFGFGSGMVQLTIFTAFSPYFNKRKALSLGLTSAGSGIGMIVIPPLLRVLFDNFPFSMAMHLYAGVCLQTLVLAYLLRPFSYYEKWTKSAKSSFDDLTITQQNSNAKDNFHITSNDIQDKMRGRSFSLGANNLQKLKLPDSNATFLSAPDNIHSLSSDKPQRTEQQLSFLQILTNSMQAIECLEPITKYNSSEKLDSDEKSTDIENEGENKENATFNWRLAYNPWCLALGIATLAYTSGIGATLQCIPPLGKEIGLSKEFVSILLSVTGFVEIPMKIFNGWFADQKFITAPTQACLFMLFTGITAFLCAILRSTAGIIAMLIGVSLTGTSVLPLMPVIAGEIFGKENVRSATAINFVYIGLSNILSTFCAGGIYEHSKRWNQVFYYVFAFSVLGSFLMLPVIFVTRRAKRNQTSDMTQ